MCLSKTNTLSPKSDDFPLGQRPFQPPRRQAARPPGHGSQGAASPAQAALLPSGHQPAPLPSAAPLTMSSWGPCNLTDGRSASAGQCPRATPTTFRQISGATKADTLLPQAALRQAPGRALRRVVPDRSSSLEGPARPSCAHEGRRVPEAEGPGEKAAIRLTPPSPPRGPTHCPAAGRPLTAEPSAGTSPITVSAAPPPAPSVQSPSRV